MTITHFLLQSNFPTLQQTFRFRSPEWHSIAFKRNYFYYSPCFMNTSPNFDIKCFIMSHKHQGEEECFREYTAGEGTHFKKVATNKNGLIWRSMENVIKALRIPVVITGVLLGLLLLFDHHQGRLALAASGGSMGGSDFSSSSDSDIVSDSDSDSDSDSSWWSSPESSSSEVYSTQKAEPIGRLDAIISISIVVFVLYFYIKWYNGDLDVAKTSVLKLQVGSLGTGRLLQQDLNRIANVANTSNSKGVHFVLQESILALLRHSEYCISGYSSVDVKSSVVECQERFNQTSIEERGKFDEETLVNINNIRKKSATSQSSNGHPNEYIVVTIIVAARCVPLLPPIKSSAQLKEALQKLASIPSRKIMGVVVLWTPQKEDDSLTAKEMLEDYPQLRRF
ncbi:hypothetical protein HanPI659440_Chr15g0602341 [Helianthus annuus]|nr:hypothetical protein HanPI659440_Chr15g0602341 [Helianthus annuus]